MMCPNCQCPACLSYKDDTANKFDFARWRGLWRIDLTYATIADGEMIPKGFGVGHYDWDLQRIRIYPIPLNLFVKVGWWLWAKWYVCFVHTKWVPDVAQRAYTAGVFAERRRKDQDRLTATVNEVLRDHLAANEHRTRQGK